VPGKNTRGVNQYTPDNVNELSLEKEQLVREERRMEAPESRDVLYLEQEGVGGQIKMQGWTSTCHTMEMSYLWRMISWLEQSEVWMHQRAEICNFCSRMEQEVRTKITKYLKVGQWRVGGQRKSAFKCTRVERN
jgi:hypothetical protein